MATCPKFKMTAKITANIFILANNRYEQKLFVFVRNFNWKSSSFFNSDYLDFNVFSVGRMVCCNLHFSENVEMSYFKWLYI